MKAYHAGLGFVDVDFLIDKIVDWFKIEDEVTAIELKCWVGLIVGSRALAVVSLERILYSLTLVVTSDQIQQDVVLLGRDMVDGGA